MQNIDNYDGLLTNEQYYKSMKLLKSIKNKDINKITNIGFIEIAKSINYEGSLLNKDGSFLWTDCIDMLCDLCLYSRKEAYLYIITYFPSRLNNINDNIVNILKDRLHINK